MPVLECSCGMVMSVSSADPRLCCIRCGGVEFTILQRRKPAYRAADQSETRPALDAESRPAIAVVFVDAAPSELVAGGCYL